MSIEHAHMINIPTLYLLNTVTLIHADQAEKDNLLTTCLGVNQVNKVEI